MKLLKTLAAIGCAGVFAAAAAPASATATLYLDDGLGNTITIADGSGSDSCGAAGCVTWIGTLGIWDINVTTGISKSPTPSIDLNSVDHSTAAGTLTIYFGDTDFTVGAGSTNLHLSSQIGGTTEGSVTWASCVADNNSNQALPPQGPGCSTIAGPFGPAGPGAFSASNSFVAPVTGTFGLANGVTITHTGEGLTSFDFALKAVPEPATLALMGLSLAGLGFGLRRKQD